MSLGGWELVAILIVGLVGGGVLGGAVVAIALLLGRRRA